MSLTSKDRKNLRCLYQVLEEFKKISPTMPVQQILAFIDVALHEGTSLKELVQLSQVKTATMSRHLIDLGPRNRRMEPGYQLIDCRQDPMELRKNQYTLSDRGKYLINNIARKMDGHGDLR